MERKQKKRKERDAEEVATRKLTTQLDAIVRTIEYIAKVQIYLPRDRPVMVNDQDACQKYLPTVGAEGAQHQ